MSSSATLHLNLRALVLGLLCAAAVAVFLPVQLPAAPAADELTEEQREYLEQKDTIVFISQSNYPPFEFVDEEGNLDGMCVELARWVATEYGFKTRFVNADFEAAQLAVLTGEADVLTSLFHSEAREARFDFTEVIFDVPASIFVRKERFDISSPNNLRGKRIAMQAGDYAAEFLEKKGIVYTLVPTRDFAEAVSLVARGEADALVGDEQIVYHAIYTNDWAGVMKKVGDPLYVGRNCMATRDGERVLTSILNAGFERARQHGIHERISGKWAGSPTANAEVKLAQRHAREIFTVLGLLFLAALVVLLWNIHLRTVVAARTRDLAERETWLSTLLDVMNDALVVADQRTGAIIDANARFRQIFGYTAEQSRLLNLPELCGLDDDGAQARTDFLLERVRAGEPQLIETILRTNDGRRFWCECSLRGASLAGEDRALLLIRDISERKKREAELQVRERDFQALSENSPDIIFRHDLEMRFVYVNRAALDATGIDPEVFAGRKPDEAGLPAELCTRLESAFEEVAESGREVAFEFALQHGGKEVCYQARLVPEFGADGGMQTILGVARDITRLKTTEQELNAIKDELESRVEQRTSELRRLEQQQKAILNNITDMAWLKDREGRFIAVNEAVGHACGRRPEDVLGHTDFDFWPQDLAERYRNDDEQVMRSRQMLRIEEPFQKSNDRVIWLETIKMPVFASDGSVTGTTGIARDITHRKEFEQVLQRSNIDLEAIVRERTLELEHANDELKREMAEKERLENERRRLESQVQQSQKLESMGVLAGGIAHDFNNLLMGILGNIDLAFMETPDSSAAKGYLTEAEIASRRAADLCRQMLAYSGRGRFVIEVFDINRVIEEMAHLLRVPVSTHASLQYRLAHGLPPVEGDITQVRQVVMNLITNAAEAIEGESGVITVATGVSVWSSEELAKTWLDDQLPAGPYVFFEVSDTGTGMNEETLRRIFEPFYTTKFTGRGLGLAAVLGIVRSHKGAIDIHSKPGEGTTFRVLLPASTAPQKTMAPEAPRAPSHQARGTILLVDDEETVRTVGSRMLEKAGFQVVTANDGLEAVEIFRARPESFDLVILDLMMPRMDGESALRELRRISPTVRVLLSSGYSEQEILGRFAGNTIAGFIQKPYRHGELLDKLATALDLAIG